MVHCYKKFISGSPADGSQRVNLMKAAVFHLICLFGNSCMLNLIQILSCYSRYTCLTIVTGIALLKLYVTGITLF